MVKFTCLSEEIDESLLEREAELVLLEEEGVNSLLEAFPES